jgi:uncharacterized repeat protein (TIGR02543 family)
MKMKNLLRTAALTAATLLLWTGVGWGQFANDNLAIVVAAASANNTTASVIEINKTDVNQTPIQTILIPGTGVNAIRVSGSATSTLYATNSADGSLFCFTGHYSDATGVNANTILPRAVVTINNAGGVNIGATYTGTSGNQTRCATTLDNTNFYIADQGGQFTNDATTASPTGNLRGMKTFGGVVYVSRASSTAGVNEVVTTSAITGGAFVDLPGIANSASHQDFYLISSGANGAAFDILYIVRATSNTAGTIAKYSFVTDTWVANGTFTTDFGGFGLVAEKSGSGTNLYVTSGQGALAANKVRKLTDNAGYNADINITANIELYTAGTGTIVKGIAFAPIAGVDNTPPVATFNPANGATDVAVDVHPTITFNEAIRNIDDSEITNANVASLLTLTDPSKGAFPFTATIDGDKKVITITPNGDLANEVVYTVGIAPVEDASDNAALLQTASFTTISNTTPIITLTSTHTGPYYAGDEVVVTWTSANIETVVVQAWVPSEGMWMTMASAGGVSGSAFFDIPLDAQYSALYKLRVKPSDAETPVSESGTFKVRAVAMDLETVRGYLVNDEFRFDGTAIVTFTRPAGAPSYNQKFIVDATAGMLIHDASTVITTPYAIGDGMSGLVARRAVFNQLVQIVPLADPGAPVSTGNEIVPELKTLSNITSADQGKLVKVNGVTFASSGTFAAGQNYTITDASKGSMFFRTQFAEADYIGQPIPQNPLDLVMLVGQYNADIQLSARSLTDITVYYQLTVVAGENGEVSSEGGLYEEGDEITLTATPIEGYVFENWTDASKAVVSTENPYTFNMPGADLTLTANFRTIVSASINPSELSINVDENPEYIETVVTWNDASSVEEVNLYFPSVEEWMDYSGGWEVIDIDGETATLKIWVGAKKANLSKDNDFVEFHITFDQGDNAILKVNVLNAEWYVQFHVTDLMSGVAIENAEIFVPAVSNTFTTDEFGYASFGLPSGIYHVNIIANGYSTNWNYEINVVAWGNNEFEVQLVKVPVVITEFPWVEDFENGMDNWMVLEADGEETSWELTTDYNHTPEGAQSAVHFYGDNGNNDEGWLISPQLNLPWTWNGMILKFWSYNAYPIWYGKNSVLISTGSANPADGDFVEVWSPSEVTASWVETTINLSDYAGQNIFVAFKYEGEDSHDWYIDDVSVSFFQYPEIEPNPQLYSLSQPADVEFSVNWGSESEISGIDYSYWTEEDEEVIVPLVEGVDYTLAGDVLTISQTFVEANYQEIGDWMNFVAKFGMGSEVYFGIVVVYTTTPSLIPSEVAYDLTNPGDVFTNIFYAQAEAITSVSVGGTELVEGEDYHIDGTFFFVHNSYLSNLLTEVDDVVAIDVEFDTEDVATLTITAIESGVLNATINPTSATYNNFMPEYQDITITWNDATAVTGLNVKLNFGFGFEEFEWPFYEVTDNGDGTANLRIFFDEVDKMASKETTYISNALITISFDAGAPSYFFLTIIETYYDVIVNVNPEEAGWVWGAYDYSEGETVELGAGANFGYRFVNWTDEQGVVLSTESEYSFVMPAHDVVLNANFEMVKYVSFYVYNQSNSEFIGDAVITINGVQYESGNYYIGLPVGSYTYFVSREGFITVTGTFEVVDVDLNINVPMVAGTNPTFTVTFTIADGESNPITDAVVTFNGVEGAVGEYAFTDVEPGVYSYSVTKDGFVTSAGTVTVTDEDVTVPVTLTLVGINTNTFANFSAYPNPFSGTINLSNPAVVSRVYITNIIGQRVMDVATNGAGNVETATLPAGIYLVTFEAASGERTVRKMVKK